MSAKDAEYVGSLYLRRVQAELYAHRSEYLNKPNIFHQGRTIGFAGVEVPLKTRLESVFATSPLRILLEIRGEEKGQARHFLERHGYTISEGLIKFGTVLPQLQDRSFQCNTRLAEIDSFSSPETVGGLQKLQVACSITPTPGWCLRGDDFSRCTMAFWQNSELAAAGTVTCFKRSDGRNDSVISNICVDPAYRRKHYGRLLTTALIRKAYEFGATHVFSIVEQDNIASKNLQLACSLKQEQSEFLFCCY
jgi:hypothetical protein